MDELEDDKKVLESSDDSKNDPILNCTWWEEPLFQGQNLNTVPRMSFSEQIYYSIIVKYLL